MKKLNTFGHLKWVTLYHLLHETENRAHTNYDHSLRSFLTHDFGLGFTLYSILHLSLGLFFLNRKNQFNSSLKTYGFAFYLPGKKWKLKSVELQFLTDLTAHSFLGSGPEGDEVL